MLNELDLSVAIMAGETASERDGLAMSTRNSYLSTAERAEAPRLYRTLLEVKAGYLSGEKAVAALAGAGWKPDYIEIRRRRDLSRPDDAERELVVLGAARLGTTRLIDNVEL